MARLPWFQPTSNLQAEKMQQIYVYYAIVKAHKYFYVSEKSTA